MSCSPNPEPAQGAWFRCGATRTQLHREVGQSPYFAVCPEPVQAPVQGLKKECSIAHSYHSAQHVAVRTPVADLAGHLPAGLWRNAILGGASRLDAFSGYPFRT